MRKMLVFCAFFILSHSVYCQYSTPQGKSYNYRNYANTIDWLIDNINHVPDKFEEGAGVRCYQGDDTNCGKYGAHYTFDAAKAACEALKMNIPSVQDWEEMYRWMDKKSSKMLEGGNSGLDLMFAGRTYYSESHIRGARGSAPSLIIDYSSSELGEKGIYWAFDERGAPVAVIFSRTTEEMEIKESPGGKLMASCRCIKKY